MPLKGRSALRSAAVRATVVATALSAAAIGPLTIPTANATPETSG